MSVIDVKMTVLVVMKQSNYHNMQSNYDDSQSNCYDDIMTVTTEI